MKKRLLSLLLCLCMVLTLLPATAWASHSLSIREEPGLPNDYTVGVEYTGTEQVSYQWYRQVETPDSYTVVAENPGQGELAAESIINGVYADGSWTMEASGGEYQLYLRYPAMPDDRVTVTVPSDLASQVSGGFLLGDSLEGENGVYTATYTYSNSIDISASAALTATVTVERFFTPLNGQTAAQLADPVKGETYLCVVTAPNGSGGVDTAMSEPVSVQDPVARVSWTEGGEEKTLELAASDLTGSGWMIPFYDEESGAWRIDTATVTLLDDVALTRVWNLGLLDLTLDGGGHTIARDLGSGKLGDPMLKVEAGSSTGYTVTGLTVDGTYCGDEEPSNPPMAVDIRQDASLTLGEGARIINGGQPPASQPDYARVPSTVGGVYVGGGTLKLEGGSTITGNRGEKAGGVYAAVGSRVEMSGAVTLQGNTKEAWGSKQPSNLALVATDYDGDGTDFTPIQITDSVAGGRIGVSRLSYNAAKYTYVTSPGVVAVGAGHTLTQADCDAFFSDDPLYVPALDETNNAIVLGDLPPHVHAMSVGCEATGGEQLTYQPLTVNSDGKLCVGGVALAADRYGDYTLGGGNYYLPGDITLGGGIIIKDAASVPTNLCLNGHTLDMGEKGCIEVKKSSAQQGGVLNLCNCGGEGKVTSAYKYTKQTAAIVSSYQFSLYGGRVESTVDSQGVTARGGAVHLYGGEVVSAQGCAVMVDYNSGSALSLSGAPKLQSGTGKADINLYNADKETPIVLDGPLTGTQPYTVKGNRAQPMVTATWKEHMAGKNFADYFQSAAKGLFVEENADGALVLTNCAITQQPTAANRYTVHANGAPGSVPTYQWYTATASKKTVATENSDTCVMAEPYEVMQVRTQPGDTISAATYANGTWTPAQDYDSGGYFTLALEEGDVLTLVMDTAAVPPAGVIGLYGGYDQEAGVPAELYYCFDGSQPPDKGVSVTTQGDNTILAYTIPADREYELVIDRLDYYDENDTEDPYKNYTAPALSATLTRAVLGDAVAGQTAATLTTTQAGDYLCQVTWPNGTTLNSDIVTLVPPHLHAMSVDCETAGEDLVTFDKALTSVDGTLYINGEAVPSNDNTLLTGRYYLAGDVTLPAWSHLYIGTDEEVDLCLNGHTLDLGSAHIILDGQLRVCDCSAEKTGAMVCNNSHDLIQVTGNFDLYGGTVENTSEHKFATAITTGIFGTATLYGGQVIARRADVLWHDYTAGALTLYDGVKLQGGASRAEICLGDMEGAVNIEDFTTSVLTIAEPLTAPETPWRLTAFRGQVFTDGWATHMADKDFNDYFTCIDQGRFIEKTADGELALVDYAITTQPTAANGYTVTANGAPSGYQWYEAAVTTAEITGQNAAPYEHATGSIAASDYKNGKWTAAQSGETPSTTGYFTLALQKGDKVAVTLATDDLPDGGQLGLVRDFYEPGEYVQVWYPFDGDTEGYSHVGTAAEDGDNTVITYVIPADGTYTLMLDGLGLDQTAPDLAATLTGVTVGAAVTGQTARTLTADEAGNYLCRVSWPDGTTKDSDLVAYTPPACDHTWGKWTLDDDGETLTRVCGKDASHVETDTLLCALPSAPILYDGTAKTPAVSAKTPGAGALEKGTHYTVTYQNNVNVGTATVTVTGKGDYDFTLERTFTIGKGKVKTQDLQPGSLNIANGLANEYAYTLTLLCPAVGGSWGERTYAIESVVFDRAGYYTDGAARIDKLPGGTYANRLFLPILRNDTDFEGVVGTVTIRFSSDNYEDYTNTIAIRATNKAAVTFEGVTTPDKTYDGTAYAFEGTLVTRDKKSGYVVNADVEILYTGRNATSYSPADPHTPPTDAGEYAMTIRVVDTDPNYIGRDPNYNFVIRQAPGVGAVTMSGYAEGETPSAPIATSATNGVEGVSFRYKAKGAADSAYGTQPPTAAGEYTVQATFPATRNYAAFTATADFTVTKSAVTPPQGETKGEVEVKPGTPAVSVDQEALKDLAGTVEQGQTVTVTLTVEKLAAPAADEKAELEGIMTGEKGDVLYLDLSLLKQVNDEAPQPIEDTGDKVLEIAVPYDFTGKKDVRVYRKHANSAATALTGLSARPAGDFADGTFFADNQGGVVYIYAGKFSTYAIGYTAVEEEPAPTPSRRPSRRPSREEVTPLPFVDVATTDPFYEAVRYVYENKLMVGTTQTTFVPEGQLTRAMLAVILYRAAGSPKVEGAPEFTDTLADTWYSDAVVWASQTRVLRGYGNGQFGPHDPVSKEMMNLVTARQAGQDPAWVGDPALAVPATRAEMAQALMGQKK